MANGLFEPEDNQKYRDIYESQGKGICGITALAVIQKCSITMILKKWGDYEGYAPNRKLRAYLEGQGYKVKLFRGNKRKDFPIENKVHLCRVQWVGEEGGKFHGYSNWHDATCNTHLIVIDNDMFYCNAQGWAELRWLPEYLEHGYITSYLEVIPPQCGNCGLSHQPNTKCSMQPEGEKWNWKPLNVKQEGGLAVNEEGHDGIPPKDKSLGILPTIL